MARLRSYYSLDEIITDRYTNGNELMYEDTAIPYVGIYHRYTTGEVYTEPNWVPALSKKLIPLVDTTSINFKYKKLIDIKTNYKSVNKHILSITSDDFKNGYVTRYFINKVNEQHIFEISKDDYDAYNGSLIDPNLYNAISIKWVITGIPATEEKNGITTPGVAEQNKKEVIKAEQYMPGISIILNKLLEFYTDTDFTIPIDINDPNFSMQVNYTNPGGDPDTSDPDTSDPDTSDPDKPEPVIPDIIIPVWPEPDTGIWPGTAGGDDDLPDRDPTRPNPSDPDTSDPDKPEPIIPEPIIPVWPEPDNSIVDSRITDEPVTPVTPVVPEPVIPEPIIPVWPEPDTGVDPINIITDEPVTPTVPDEPVTPVVSEPVLPTWSEPIIPVWPDSI